MENETRTETKRWIGVASIGDETCEHCEIEEVREEETILEAKARIVFAKGNWGGLTADEVDPEDRAWELEKWDTFVFSNEGEVKKLNAIDPPDYVDNLDFAVSEMIWCVYRAFADEFVQGDAVTIDDVRKTWPEYKVVHVAEKDDLSSDSLDAAAWVVVVRKPSRTGPQLIMAKYEATEAGEITDLIYKRNITLDDAEQFRSELAEGKLLRFENDWA